MRTAILTLAKRNDIVDTRQYMFNVNQMKSLVSRGSALTDFKVDADRYQVAVAIATLAGYAASYQPGFKISVTAIREGDLVVNKTMVLEVDNILLAYAFTGSASYATILYKDPVKGTLSRITINTTVALLNAACNASAGSSASTGARAFGKVTAVADTPQAITFTDPATGAAVTMTSTSYVYLVNGFDADGPVDVKVSSVLTTGFTITAAANCSVYYAVFQ